MLLTAFSTFAFAEYFVAAANMGYYWTIVGDLPNEEIIVRKPYSLDGASVDLPNGNHLATPSSEKKQN